MSVEEGATGRGKLEHLCGTAEEEICQLPSVLRRLDDIEDSLDTTIRSNSSSNGFEAPTAIYVGLCTLPKKRLRGNIIGRLGQSAGYPIAVASYLGKVGMTELTVVLLYLSYLRYLVLIIK